MKTTLEERVGSLFLNSKSCRFRTIILLVGSNIRKNISYLHYLWSKNSTHNNPHVLWCYRNDDSSRGNTIKKNRNKNSRDKDRENFLSVTKIQYCYYNEINKILGNTFGMCILENFEALSPNILAKVIETIEGGGVVIFLLDTVNSIDRFHSISMDIYKKFETGSYKRISGRFLERFIFSLSACPTFLAIDDNSNIISSISHKDINTFKLFDESRKQSDFSNDIFFELIKNLKNLEPLSSLIEKTRTFDQARAFLTFTEAISNKSLLTTVILTAARGRGKSAALGLAAAAGIAYGYGNIFVTAPNPENLNTFYAFLFAGLSVLNYEENKHFEILHDSRYKFINKINIYCTHRQTITFLFPGEIEKFKNEIELLIIDEAAAIPPYLLESLFGPYVILMSSTSSGYEGTGKCFSLKFIKKIKSNILNISNLKKKPYMLQEIKMDEPIRYSKGDPVEKWLNEFLCLDNQISPILLNGCPDPKSCKLFLVDRNALFSEHKIAARFLQRIISLLSSVHYKNSPDDLQMICDAPSHRILILITILPISLGILPDILCVLHVSYEGQLSRKFVEKNFLEGSKISGDLIPWVISKQFIDSSFAELSGIRIIRIAVHPDIHSMGYGSRALRIFNRFFQNVAKSEFLEKKNLKLENNILDKSSSIKFPMLINLESRNPPHIDYIGVSFGLTQFLFNFWKKNGFKLIFVRDEKSRLTGDYVCIMINPILNKENFMPVWIRNYQFEFLNRFINAMSWKFKEISTMLVYDIIQNIQFTTQIKEIQLKKIKKTFNHSDISKICFYIESSTFDYRSLSYLFPQIAKILVWNDFLKKELLKSEILLLISIGLQHKPYDVLYKEFGLRRENIVSSIKGIYIKFIKLIKVSHF
nr:N-acetyltransferase 10 [Cryptomonas sp.]